MALPGTRKRLSLKKIFHAFRIYRYILPYRWHFLTGLICLVVSTGVVSLIPRGFGRLIDAGLPAKETVENVYKVLNSSAPEVQKLQEVTALINTYKSQINPARLKDTGILLGGVLLIQAILSFFRIYLFEYVSQHAMASIRSALYEKIITLPVRFFEENRVGNLTSRLGSDVSQLQDALSNQLAFFVRQVVLPLVSLPLLIALSWKLSVIIIASLPVLVFIGVIFGRYIRSISRKAQDELAVSNTVAEETFTAIDVVKAFTNEDYENRRYNAVNQRVAMVGMRASLYRAAFVSFIIFIMFGAMVGLVYAGMSEVASGALSMGQLIEFFFLTIFVGSSLAGLSESYSVLLKTIGASERISEILEETSETKTVDAHLSEPVKGGVEFRQVSFAYPSRKEVPVLRNLSFTIEPGMKVALVGQSGSGKSTVIKLLSRFYDCDEGAILIDGKDIRDYNITALRKNFGTVPQETILFGGTIRENIAYGKTDATDEEIRRAAEQANALSFIQSFPDGFDTLVGERGVKLSGGQRQRIAIARAILRNPRILILDEATSSLDSESEFLVRDALDKLMHQRTTFIIAHRLSTIRQADLIIVLSKGKIAEQGTHEELSRKPDGRYAHLLKLQYEEV
ncbi:MAG: ABC transporter transmembrane domain-containing protein [Chitinophagales bacterium]|nr:ABC transporter transmembrane domain-containing protein [Chitinophagales bacterium]